MFNDTPSLPGAELATKAFIYNYLLMEFRRIHMWWRDREGGGGSNMKISFLDY